MDSHSKFQERNLGTVVLNLRSLLVSTVRGF
jgi:hypothetical protein